MSKRKELIKRMEEETANWRKVMEYAKKRGCDGGIPSIIRYNNVSYYVNSSTAHEFQDEVGFRELEEHLGIL